MKSLRMMPTAAVHDSRIIISRLEIDKYSDPSFIQYHTTVSVLCHTHRGRVSENDMMGENNIANDKSILLYTMPLPYFTKL